RAGGVESAIRGAFLHALRTGSHRDTSHGSLRSHRLGDGRDEGAACTWRLPPAVRRHHLPHSGRISASTSARKSGLNEPPPTANTLSSLAARAPVRASSRT